MNKWRKFAGAAGVFIGDKVLWGGAAAAVILVHVGAVLWVLETPPVMIVSSPPAAIMIEFASTIETTNTEETELSVETQDNQASVALEEIKTPDTEMEQEQEEEPEEAPETPAPKLDVEQEAEVALPPPPKPKKKRPQARPQTKSTPTKDTVKAKNRQAQQTKRNAASQSARGAGKAANLANWQSRLSAHLERYKPRSKGKRGTAYVAFRIDGAGNVLSVKLARSSGNPAVDKMALNLVRRASPVPPPPPNVKLSFTVPIRFSRR